MRFEKSTSQRNLERVQNPLSLKLQKLPGGALNLVAAEVAGAHFTTRTEFHAGSTVAESLRPELSAAITKMLVDLPTGRMVIARPKSRVEMPGLTLASVQIVLPPIKNGIQDITFRYLEVLGGINHAFAEDIGLDEHMADRHECAAIEVLTEIATPLLNLSRHGRGMNRPTTEQIINRHRQLAERADEISFYIDLLRRYARNTLHGHDQRETPRPNLYDKNTPLH